MVVKVLQVRDSMTHMGVLAMRVDPADDFERHELARVGYGLTAEAQRRYVLVGPLDTLQLEHDPMAQKANRGGTRTLCEAHRYIAEHFDELKSGDVVDVEFILGETKAPKTFEW